MGIQRMDTAGVELTPAGRKATTIAGDPVEAWTALYEDHVVETGVWECTPGSFTSSWDGIMETIHVIAGAGDLVEQDGTRHELSPGALIVMPAGAKATWEIRETVVKSYTIVQVATAAPPRG